MFVSRFPDLRSNNSPGGRPWGDGLADPFAVQPPATWADVEDDELALYWPALSLPAHDAARRTRLRQVIAQSAQGPGVPDAMRSLLFDFLERVETGHRDAVPLSHATHQSFHSGINAAYVYRQYDWAGEMFLTACWLGHLARGRACRLPVSVAARLVDTADRSGLRGASRAVDDDAIQALTEAVPGRIALFRAARRVLASGVPALVRPERSGGLSLIGLMRKPIHAFATRQRA